MISVAAGESETMRRGGVVMVSGLPLEPTTVTGNVVDDATSSAAGGAGDRERPAGERSQRRRGRAGRASAAPEPPFREGFWVMEEHDRSSDSGLAPSPPSRLAPVASWRGSISPYSGGTVPDSHRVPSPCSVVGGEPIIGRCAARLARRLGSRSSPGRAVIFAFSAVPDLGHRDSGRLGPRAAGSSRDAAEYAILGALLVRATGRAGAGARPRRALRRSSDEFHQTFVAGPARQRRWTSRSTRSAWPWGSRCGSPCGRGASRDGQRRAARHRARRARGHAAAVVGMARVGSGACSAIEPGRCCPADRGAAGGTRSTQAGAGNWRTLPRAVRRGPRCPRTCGATRATSAALQSLASARHRARASSRTRRRRSRASRWRSSAPPRRVSRRRVRRSGRAGAQCVAALGPASGRGALARGADLLRSSVESRAWSSATSATASSTRCWSGSTGSPRSSSASTARPSGRTGFTLRGARAARLCRSRSNALAYAALGQAPPRVRRRAS